MVSAAVKVWLPDAGTAALVGSLPDGMTADLWDGDARLPDSAGEVEVVVLPFGVPAERGAPSPAVAEWIMSVILAQTRLLPRFLADQREDHWDFARSGALAGQTALIVGYGSIGATAEPLLAAFGVTVERIDRRPREGVSGLDSLPAALARAGIVIILLPMTPDTRAMVDARFLSQMRDHALLVNAARGPIVDTAALLAELRSGRLRAALDVTDPEPLPAGHPLWSAPGLLLTPHVAGATTQSLERVAAIVRDQLTRYASGQPLLNVVGPDGY